MRKAIFSLALLVSFAASVPGQQSVPGTNTANALKPATTTPTGACYRNQVRINVSTVYICPQSGTATWTAVGGSSGIATGDSPTLTGQWTWSLANAAAVAIGPNGNTNPTFRVVTNIASAATGLSVTGNAAGSGVTLSALSSGTNENIIFAPKGTGQVVVPAGSASLPGIISNAASTTGFFFNSNPEINAILSGSGAFRLVGGAAVFKSTTQLGFNSTSDPATSGSQDTAVTRGAAGVWRFTNGGTGASRILLGTSSDTSAAQLDVRSQTVGVPAAQFQCASGESATANCTQVKNGAGTTILGFRQDGTFALDRTLIAGGTTGAQTINKAAFSVNFAAAATSLVVTNSVVATTSGATCQVMTNDTTMKHVQAVAGSGTLTLYPDAAPTAETKVYCEIRN